MKIKDLHRFMAAERQGRDATAEGALRALFAALPEAVPRPGFADRVLRAAGVLEGVSPAPAPWSLPARLGAAVALASTGLAAAFVLPALFAWLRMLSAGQVAGAAIETLAGVASRLDEALALARLASSLAQVLWSAATAPPVALALLSLAAVAALVYRGLCELLAAPPRRAGYA